jgi:hypothetical protein
VSDGPLARFDEANRLWFGVGASGRALAQYEVAAHGAPDDAVIAFQLARARWALGRQHEVAPALAAAETNADALSPTGRSVLAQARPRLASPPAEVSGIDSASLDAEVLEQRELPAGRWLDVARAARERDMYGLAAHATARASSFIDPELEREEHELRQEGRAAVSLLEAMRAEPRPIVPDIFERRAGADRPVPTRAPSAAPRPVCGPVAPTLDIEIAPAVSTVNDDDEVLTVVLSNRTGELLAVNARLLVNNPGSPPGYGELSLSVDGPPGYVNNTAFNVRTGPPPPGDFVVLERGASVEQSYRLRDYESLDVPGTYRIWVTYRNDIAESVGGLPAFVGAVSSEAAAIERRPPI